MTEPTLLIIGEKHSTLETLSERIRSENPYRVLTESNPANVLDRLEREAVDLILCDMELSQVSGLELVEKIRDAHRDLPVVVYSESSTAEEVAAAMRKGATHYVAQPHDPRLLAAAVDFALSNVRLASEVEKLKRRLGGDHKLGGLVGRSAAMHRVFDLIREVCEVDSTVLIRGETGTGKELVARALHFEGPRSAKPFVKVNCAALPETLLESELFGHERGAFTDAKQMRVGKFELANGGTIFLDEIGDLSLSTQIKLLNVLQDREVERLGSNRRIPVNIRVITATNRNLEQLIQEGHFRIDLYYRLNVVPITITPLRERGEDIPLLCAHFLDKIGSRLGKGAFTITDEAMALLLSHNWPGNVRELENAIERAILATSGTEIGAEAFSFLRHLVSAQSDVPGWMPLSGPENFPPQFSQPRSDSGAPVLTTGPLKPALRSFEKMFIESALSAAGGHVIRAARMLKIDRTTLWKKARDLGINMHAERE
ncbi:MAG: sigma-54 dependent transcriptional regulator [bacterium]|nr:sigma-54 dependent transcriptional regulator [bacterium]